MFWIELKDSMKINGVQRQPGYRTEYARAAALALIANGRAVAVDGPHEGRSGAGYPVDVVPGETTDPEKDDAVRLESKDSNNSEKMDDLADEQESESPGEDGSSWVFDSSEDLEDDNLKKTLDDLDFELVEGVGPSIAERIEEAYDDLEAFRSADLTEIDGISKARAKKLRDLDG